MNTKSSRRAHAIPARRIVRDYLMLLFLVPWAAALLSGCSVDPERENVKQNLIKHFEARRYSVKELEISKIEEVPLGQREYMAPKKYVVYVPLITLEHTGQGPMTFKDVVITIQKTRMHGVWSVNNISGIPLT